jgi:hypothetical protein
MLADVKFGIFLSSTHQGYLKQHAKNTAYKTRPAKRMILPALLYGCETWSLTLTVEHSL